jgi:hypothetical protein
MLNSLELLSIIHAIFGHYFDWHFQTVYPIDANDMALESYGLGATFHFDHFCGFLTI